MRVASNDNAGSSPFPYLGEARQQGIAARCAVIVMRYRFELANIKLALSCQAGEKRQRDSQEGMKYQT